jgi:hypothetical protein
VTVANDIRGIGQDLYDVSSSFGSAGRLRSLVYMDHVGKNPDDPTAAGRREGRELADAAADHDASRLRRCDGRGTNRRRHIPSSPLVIIMTCDTQSM